MLKKLSMLCLCTAMFSLLNIGESKAIFGKKSCCDPCDPCCESGAMVKEDVKYYPSRTVEVEQQEEVQEYVEQEEMTTEVEVLKKEEVLENEVEEETYIPQDEEEYTPMYETQVEDQVVEVEQNSTKFYPGLY